VWSTARSTNGRSDHDSGEEITQRALAADPANLYSNLFAPMSAIYRNDLAAMTDRVKRAVHIGYQRQFGTGPPL
jgi:hypothetical protein